MNFDVKISDAYEAFFLKIQGKQTGDSSAAINKKNTFKNVYAEDIDDGLFRLPKAQKKINKKLKDTKFMSKLQKECEQHVREHPDEFRRVD